MVESLLQPGRVSGTIFTRRPDGSHPHDESAFISLPDQPLFLLNHHIESPDDGSHEDGAYRCTVDRPTAAPFDEPAE